MNNEKRRQRVSFDAFYFENEKSKGTLYSMQQTFLHIAKINLWGSADSVSGVGSTHAETRQIKDALLSLVQDFNIQSILDAPCGDFHWLSTLDLPVEKYTGVDILEDMVNALQKNFGDQQKRFIFADICEDGLPYADLIICRDCFVHFSFDDIFRALQVFKRSGARYLLTTTFTDTQINENIITGDWRTLNLQRAPFYFPAPLRVLQYTKEGQIPVVAPEKN